MSYKPHYTSFFRKGDAVYIREVLEDNTRRNFSFKYKPKLYLVDEYPNSDYTNLDGQGLNEIQFSSIKDAKAYSESFRGTLYGYNRWEYSAVDDEYPYDIEYNFDNLRIVYLDIETKSDTHYSTVSNPDQPIILIQMLFKDTFYIFGTEFYESYDDKVKYIKCSSEEDMLKKFVKVFNKLDPDIISGWNSQGYDIPMIYSRMCLLDIEDTFKKLSPFGMIDIGEKVVFGKSQLRIDLRGVQHLDMLELIKKFDNKKYENNKLNTVSTAILGRGKVAYEGNLYDLYVKDFEKFVEYGKVDTELVRDIEAEKNLIRLVTTVAYMDKANFIDAFSQVRMWDNQIMTNLKHEYKIQVPFKIAKEADGFEEDEDDKFEGAFVFKPTPGKYEWVMSDDVQSMHPSIIMSFNISPETYLGNSKKNVDFFLKDCKDYTREIQENKATSLANGAMFDNTYEGFLPKLVRRVFKMRVDAKNEAKKYKKLIQSATDTDEKAKYVQGYVINDTLQNALKVKINSMFGFLGNKFSRFYQLDMAEGITLTSQVMLKSGASQIEDTIRSITNTKDNILLYGDTDSLIYSMKSVVDKFVPKGTSPQDTVEFLDRFHKKYIAPALTEKLTEIQNRMNAREHSIRFVRDVISDVSILIAKKKYIMSVWDSEGTRYNKQDFKIMGVESVKTSTPQYCRDKIKDAIEIILYSTEDVFHKFISETKDKFMELPIEDIAFPRGVSDIDKYTEGTYTVDTFGSDEDEESITYKKGSPIQVKASVFYNKLLSDMGLTNWYQPIENGDKIKFCYLRNPNPIKNNAIAFIDKLPNEFRLDSYIDKHLQWEKAYFSPVKAIADIVKWDMEPTNALF